MSVLRSRRLGIGGFFLLVALVILLILIAPLLFPTPKSINLSENDGHIVFSAAQSAVALSGNCLSVSWQVDQIDAVFLNDQPVVGAGEKEICVQPDVMPT